MLWADRGAQVVEYLLSKHEGPKSKPQYQNKNNNALKFFLWDRSLWKLGYPCWISTEKKAQPKQPFTFWKGKWAQRNEDQRII
jgi:hypothetical protein